MEIASGRDDIEETSVEDLPDTDVSCQDNKGNPLPDDHLPDPTDTSLLPKSSSTPVKSSVPSDVILPPPPEEPLQEDCCGTGCVPCVFDIYNQELKLWEAECQRIREGGLEPEKIDPSIQLSPTEYRPFTIEKITPLSHDTNVYTFSLPSGQCLGLHAGQHIILRNRDSPPLTRQYTPISDVKVKGSFDVLIKVYPTGKMSQYVQTWRVGDQVDWRGPCGQFVYKPNKHKKILMLAAGTGIAPMVQIIREILHNENDETVVRLLYASRSFDNTLLKCPLLDDWSHYWNFSVKYFLSNDEKDSVLRKKKYADDIHFGRISREIIKEELSTFLLPSTFVLTCGTKSFDKDMINFCTKCGVPRDRVFKF